MTYDANDRLRTAASCSFGGLDCTHRFSYDSLDNLTSWILAGVKDYARYVYDPVTRRLGNIKDSSDATIVALEYDDQGNLRYKNNQSHSFDFGNRLREVSGKEYYRYDGHGRRVMAWEPTSQLNILSQYSQGGQILYQENQRTGKVDENIYLAGSLVAIREWTAATGYAAKFQHTDALGSPVAVTNQAGQVVERNEYEPYGAVIGKPNYQGIGFTGHVQDAATGLTYMQQRYYDPQVGLFLSVDPVTALSSPVAMFNRYKYAANNPYRFVDPDGRAESTWFGSNDGLYLSNTKFYANGAHTISGHANQYYMLAADARANSGTVRVGGAAAIERAQSLDGLRSGQTVLFAACEIGKGAGTEAQRAADSNGGMVIAPDGYVFSPSTSKGYAGEGSINLTVNSDVNGKGNAGAFRIFTPGGNGPVPGVSISSMSYNPKSGEFSASLNITKNGVEERTQIKSLEEVKEHVK
jgi:RHS repeat-associated protein